MKTFSERFGLVDNDLASPEHDAIMVQLNADKFAAIFKQVIPPSVLAERLEQNKLEVLHEPLFSIKHEVPIISNGYAVGFLDAVGSLSLKVRWNGQGSNEVLYVPIEVKTKIISYGETLRQLNFYLEYFIKQKHNNHSYINPPVLGPILITKDKSFKEQFEQNGIYVYLWEDNHVSV